LFTSFSELTLADAYHSAIYFLLEAIAEHIFLLCVSLYFTSYYHCVSRCVRRAFLCGTDQVSGQCYEHRRAWIEDKILALAEIFAIDICAYAVMSNHYHIVFHINRSKANGWSNSEVIQRWHQLYKGNFLSQQAARGLTLGVAEQQVLDTSVAQWRERLHSISQFMQVLNESIARQANAEDQCTGRFWEGRYKSQALLDEAALAACMVYVDLNPIRAGRECSIFCVSQVISSQVDMSV
jgi:REP element-mobilizing transposase RayT